MYLRGALDSAHFHCMRKAIIYQKDVVMSAKYCVFGPLDLH
jgi:hypothetical protein